MITSLLVIIILAYLAMMIILAVSWKGIKNDSPEIQTPSVSVVIPVRNEAQNIVPLLEDLDCQDYDRDKLEIIIVDDHSTDSTPELVSTFSSQASHNIKLIKQTENGLYPTPKKRALTTGVNAANGDLIVTTDGDCRVGKQWLSTLVNEFENQEVNFISAPVSFSHSDSIFQRMQAIEFASLIGVGASSIGLGYPNFCNGANLAFRKEKFKGINGYNGNDHIASGDDEFLLQKFAKDDPSQIRFVKDRKALVETVAKKTLGEFYHQRKRWNSKLRHHNEWHIRTLVYLLFFSNLSLIGLVAAVVVGHTSPWLLITTVLLKYLVEFYFVGSVFSFTGKKLNPIEFLIVFIIHPFFIVFFGIFANFGTFKWKGRTYHE